MDPATRTSGTGKDRGTVNRQTESTLPVNDKVATGIPAHPRLEVRGLSASYRANNGRLPVLADVAVTVGPGEFVALIGPSGCGKSSLLDIVAGLADADRGDIWLDGRPTRAGDRIGNVGYMRQRDLLLPWRTALGNAAIALEVGGLPRNEARAEARQRFPDFGLAGFEDAYPAQLSGGMRQRVAFLRTLSVPRPLLLLDEPFGALDGLTRAAMQDWLLGVLDDGVIERAGRPGVLLVTHDVEEATLLADRVVVLTAAPGRVCHVEPNGLARPRHRQVITDPDFLHHKTRVLTALGLLPTETGR